MYKSKLSNFTKDILIYEILLFPILVLTSYIFINNTILKKVLTLGYFGFIALSILLIILEYGKIAKLKLWTLVTIVLLMIGHYIFRQNDQGMYKCFITTILVFTLFSDSEYTSDISKKFKDNYLLIQLQMVVSELLLLIYLALPIGYQFVWGGRYYIGPFSNPHTATYFLLTIMIFASVLRVMKPGIINTILLLIPFGITILTGARIPFGAAMLIMLINYINDYKNNKLYFKIETGFLVLAIVTFLIIAATNIIEIPVLKKMMDTIKDSNVSNSRSDIWKYNLKIFWLAPIWRKIIGFSIVYPFFVAQTYIGASVWAHNDFIHLLVSFGIVGLAAYIILFGLFSAKCKNAVITVMLIFLAFCNGLFTYDVFIMALPMLPLMNLKDRDI